MYDVKKHDDFYCLSIHHWTSTTLSLNQMENPYVLDSYRTNLGRACKIFDFYLCCIIKYVCVSVYRADNAINKWSMAYWKFMFVRSITLSNIRVTIHGSHFGLIFRRNVVVLFSYGNLEVKEVKRTEKEEMSVTFWRKRILRKQLEETEWNLMKTFVSIMGSD